jgi:hypothetical protein
MKEITLASVAEDALAGEPFGMSLANFLDAFYARPRAEAFSKRPSFLAGKIPDGEAMDAYLAATAEELARKFQLAAPDWIEEKNRRLRFPWFASSLQGLRGVLIVESPVGFRSRNLFVSENVLSRA